MAVLGPSCDLLFQQIQTPEAEVWYCHYLLIRDSGFSWFSKLPKLELQFSLSDSFTYHGEGLGDRELHEGNFNLLYVPSVDNRLYLRAGRIHTTFEIHLTSELICKLAGSFPILGPFLGKVEKGEAALLCPLDQRTTTGMTRIMEEILDNPYMGSTKESYTVMKVMELLIVALGQITDTIPVSMAESFSLIANG